MADRSHIEWTDATWNPITGCQVVSPGCTNCYAMRLAGTRMKHHWSRKGLTQDSKAGPVWTGEVRFNEEWLDQPLRWAKPRRIFVCAHGDLFAEGVPDEWIDRIFAVMALCPQHTFQVLTKRAARMRAYLTAEAGQAAPSRQCRFLGDLQVAIRNGDTRPDYGEALENHVLRHGWPIYGEAGDWPLPNVWLGVSVEDQARADERIPDLLATPAAVRFISAEPLLGPINLARIAPDLPGHIPNRKGIEAIEPLTGKRYRYNVVRAGGKHFFTSYSHGWNFKGQNARLDWVIVGGESGPGARPMHPDWPRSLRDQCQAAGVAFHFKQWGEWAEVRDVDGSVRSEGAGSIGAWRSSSGWRFLERGDGHAEVWRVGKKTAGRLLDGRTHDELPS
jgi:protein gp37